MSDVDFSDLIPPQQAAPDAGLSFDDLIPTGPEVGLPLAPFGRYQPKEGPGPEAVPTPAPPEPPPPSPSPEPQGPGLGQTAWDALQRGWAGLRQMWPTLDISSRMQAMDRLRTMQEGMARHLTPEQMAEARATFEKQRRELEAGVAEPAAAIAAREAEIQAIPPPETAQKAMQAETWGEFWEHFSQAPVTFITSIGAESLPQMAPGIAGAAVAGPVAGTAAAATALGAGSFGVDYLAKIREGLAEAGVDWQDPGSVKEALANPELTREILQRASRHAVPVGVLDAASLGLASKVLAPARLAATRPVTAQAVNVGAQLPAQGALGAAGEVAGSLTAGEEIRPGEVGAEFFGEFIGAPVEVATAALSRPGAQPTAPPGAAPPASAPGVAPPPAGSVPPPVAQPLPPEGSIDYDPEILAELETALTSGIPEAVDLVTSPEAVEAEAAAVAAAEAAAAPEVEPALVTEAGPEQTLDVPPQVEPPLTEFGPDETEFGLEPEPGVVTSEQEIPEQIQPVAPGVVTPEPEAEFGPEIELPGAPGETRQIPAGSAEPEPSPGAAIVDEAAAEAVEPTEAQAAAGNYRKGHVVVHGLDVSIETPRGAERRGVDKDGKPWSVVMPDNYGYIRRTEGADGDQVDVYVGPEPEVEQVFVVDQVDADTREYDEHKVMMGYPTAEQAMEAYTKAFSDGRGPDRIGAITPMTVDEFKGWLKQGDTTKPLADLRKPEPVQPEPAPEVEPEPAGPVAPTPGKARDWWASLTPQGRRDAALATFPKLKGKPLERYGDIEWGALPPATRNKIFDAAREGAMPTQLTPPPAGDKVAHARSRDALADVAKPSGPPGLASPEARDADALRSSRAKAERERVGRLRAKGVREGEVGFEAPGKSYRPGKSTHPGVPHTDLGPIQFNPEAPLGQQAQDYIVERGRETGIEHLVVLDNDGDVVGHGHGTEGSTGWTDTLEGLARDPKQSLVAHHNHPSGGVALSEGDIGMLALPGSAAIWAHHDSGGARAVLTPKARARLYRLSTPMQDASLLKLRGVYREAHLKIRGHLQDAIFARRASVGDAERAQYEVTDRVLDMAGIIEYRSNVDVDALIDAAGLTPHMQKAAVEAHRSLFDDEIPIPPPYRVDRRPVVLRARGEIGATFEARSGAAGEHRGARTDDRGGEGGTGLRAPLPERGRPARDQTGGLTDYGDQHRRDADRQPEPLRHPGDVGAVLRDAAAGVRRVGTQEGADTQRRSDDRSKAAAGRGDERRQVREGEDRRADQGSLEDARGLSAGLRGLRLSDQPSDRFIDPVAFSRFIRGELTAEEFAKGDKKWAGAEAFLAKRFTPEQRQNMGYAVDRAITGDPSGLDALTPDERAVTERLLKDAGWTPPPKAEASAEQRAGQRTAEAILSNNREVNNEGSGSGDNALDFDAVRIDHWTKDMAKAIGFFESATDKLRRAKSPVLKDLAARVDRYFDNREAAVGRINGQLRPILRKLGIKATTSERKVSRIMRPFEEYWRHHDNGRPDAARDALKDAPPTMTELVEKVKDIYSELGDTNQKLGIKVYDAKTGGWRPIGKIERGAFWPRTLRADVQRVLANPNNDRALWDQMVDALINEGHISEPSQALRFVRNYFSDEIKNDYFSGIEKARGVKLPEIFYDYSWPAFQRYAWKWTGRASQIANFGQKTAPGTKDAFETVIDQSFDPYTKQYLNAMADRVYARQPIDPMMATLTNLNVLATATQLGNPATATLNLIGGTTLNVQMFGWRAVGKAYYDLMREWQTLQQTGVDLGILGKDVLNILRDTERQTGAYFDAGDRVQEVLSKFARLTMTWGGYRGTENIIRATAMIAARGNLVDALRAWNQHPTSGKAEKYRAFMRQNRIDPNKLLAENGDGPETRRYLRMMVNIPQGSYRIDMTPVFIDTPFGRFLFKYQKFGTQVSRMFWQNFLQPFAQAVASGNPKAQVRTFLPLLRWFAAAFVGGSAILAARSFLFNYNDPGGDWEDLLKAFEEDEDRSKVWMMIFSRAWHSGLAAAMLGFFGNYIQFGYDLADQQRVKNPMDPPGLASFRAVGELVMRFIEQGKLTGDDLDHISERTLAIYRGYKRMGLTAGELVGSDLSEVKLQSAKRDLYYIRGASRRFADEMGIEARRTIAGRIGRTPMSPVNQRIADALMVGDGATARQIVLETRKSAEDPKRAMLSMRASARARQPIKLRGGNKTRLAFLAWAKDNLSKANYQRVIEADRRYRAAARAAGLMKN